MYNKEAKQYSIQAIPVVKLGSTGNDDINEIWCGSLVITILLLQSYRIKKDLEQFLFFSLYIGRKNT